MRVGFKLLIFYLVIEDFISKLTKLRNYFSERHLPPKSLEREREREMHEPVKKSRDRERHEPVKMALGFTEGPMPLLANPNFPVSY